MLSEKAYALCLLEILQEHSDAEHILPMREIIAKMQVIYGIRPDRRTIYAAAALLIGLGYDLSVYEENGVGYYLRSRPLEQSEVLLLTDAVYAFPFISARQTEQLVQKLQKQLSCHQRKKYRHLTIARQQRKPITGRSFGTSISWMRLSPERKKCRWITFTTGWIKSSTSPTATPSAPTK